MLKFALLISRFNSEITQGLLLGAQEYFKEKGFKPEQMETFYAPGAFEIPLIAQSLARTGVYSGIVCLGCVIKGDTAHFEFISLGSTLGLMQCMLATQVPITFGILTTYNEAQAAIRSAADASNKGREAAAACVETLQTLAKISELKQRGS